MEVGGVRYPATYPALPIFTHYVSQPIVVGWPFFSSPRAHFLHHPDPSALYTVYKYQHGHIHTYILVCTCVCDLDGNQLLLDGLYPSAS